MGLSVFRFVSFARLSLIDALAVSSLSYIIYVALDAEDGKASRTVSSRYLNVHRALHGRRYRAEANLLSPARSSWPLS